MQTGLLEPAYLTIAYAVDAYLCHANNIRISTVGGSADRQCCRCLRPLARVCTMLCADVTAYSSLTKYTYLENVRRWFVSDPLALLQSQPVRESAMLTCSRAVTTCTSLSRPSSDSCAIHELQQTDQTAALSSYISSGKHHGHCLSGAAGKLYCSTRSARQQPCRPVVEHSCLGQQSRHIYV
jgi:hypothetical protein